MVDVRRDRPRRRASAAKQARGPADNAPRDQGEPSASTSRSRSAASWSSVRLAARLAGRPARSTRRSQPELQQAAEAMVEDGLAEIEQRRGYPHPPRGKRRWPKDGRPDYLQGALVAMDPRTGDVRAHGRRPRLQREPLQPRRAGEAAVRLRVQAVRLRRRRSKRATRRRRVIANLNEPIATPQGDWMPEDEHSDADSMTLRTALRTSSNRAAVQLLEQRRHPEGRQLRAEAERRHAAERAVAGARRQRGHAGVADRRLRRLRRRRAWCASRS